MTKTMFLPICVENMPASFVFQPDGKLRDKVARSCAMGVTKVIAGPEQCHVIIDIKRPYHRAISVSALRAIAEGRA